MDRYSVIKLSFLQDYAFQFLRLYHCCKNVSELGAGSTPTFHILTCISTLPTQHKTFIELLKFDMKIILYDGHRRYIKTYFTKHLYAFVSSQGMQLNIQRTPHTVIRERRIRNRLDMISRNHFSLLVLLIVWFLLSRTP